MIEKNFESLKETTALICSGINRLSQKGMPGMYVRPPFVPDESGMIEFQAAIHVLNTLEADLPKMELSEEDREDLATALSLARYLFTQFESVRIITNTTLQMMAAIKTVLNKRKESVSGNSPHEDQ